MKGSQKNLMIIAAHCLLFSWEGPDFFMLIHREVAVHTNEREGGSANEMETCVCVCWTSVGGGVRSGGPPERKMNSSGRVMWVSRPFRFNYELISRQDHSTGRRAGGWGGETKENNNRERTEGWKLLLKPFSQHVGGCQKILHTEDIFTVNLGLMYTYSL